MRIKILDKKEEKDGKCLLCRATLYEYVTNLPADFRNFHIQRGIVANRFLDNLWDTIVDKKHIPPIVLIADAKYLPDDNATSLQLDSNFRVLDGLQRSHRLKEIWETYEFIEHDFVDNTEQSVAHLTRMMATRLRERGLDPRVFQRVLQSRRDGFEIEGLFKHNSLWLEIWFGLTETQQIQKMLILNAGHKSVNIKHQIELLFWSSFPDIEREMLPSKILREKDVSSASYSKSRETGCFHFAHLIAAFVSLIEGTTITTNAEFSAYQAFKDEEEFDKELINIDDQLLKSFAKCLQKLDSSLTDDLGVRWLSREVILVGIFGAIGAFAKTKEKTKVQALREFYNSTEKYAQLLNLSGFEAWRNNLNLSKINVGNINKKIVFEATLRFLNEEILEPFDWSQINIKER